MGLEGFSGENKERPKEGVSVNRNRFIVGGVKLGDGTWDNSKSASFDDSTGKTGAAFERAQKQKKIQREKRLSVPEDVHPGTVSKVWYSLRNTIIANREATKEDKSFNSRRADTIRDLEAQQKMLSEIGSRESSESRGTAESPAVRDWLRRNLSVVDALATLDKIIEEINEKISGEHSSSGAKSLLIGAYEERLRVARNLQSTLVRESLTGKK
jgi:hypothetical protein